MKFYDEEAIINPFSNKWLEERTAVSMFRDDAFDSFLKANAARKLPRRIEGCIDSNVYSLNIGGRKIAAFQMTVGAPSAVALVEEAAAAGIENLVVVGICGALKSLPNNTFIVPTFAVRDEGTSYHYRTAESDTVKLKNADKVAEIIRSLGINVEKGGVWTTDGFYRETRTRMNEVASRGCIAVDMECSALAVLAEFRGLNLYQFFFSADSLAADEWINNDILDTKAKINDIASEVALRVAIEVDKLS